jgi:hypothetical protein
VVYTIDKEPQDKVGKNVLACAFLFIKEAGYKDEQRHMECIDKDKDAVINMEVSGVLFNQVAQDHKEDQQKLDIVE